MIQKNDKLIITGAAGLTGQNLILLLREQGYTHIVAIDKHETNLNTLKRLNPDIQIILADLAVAGAWQAEFADAAAIAILHAQITGLKEDIFIRNNILATQHVLDAIKLHAIPYVVHISSSVVLSKADDLYTHTKKKQEQMVLESGVTACVLRPTLMFGWFDPKHLGWLSRFMERVKVFPLPGRGQYIRQPLYNRDFCRVIIAALEQQPKTKIFDIVGHEKITYVDIIRLIKKTKRLSTWILPIPFRLFKNLLRFYALFSKRPPFTAQQLDALIAGDIFIGIDIEATFGVTPTPLTIAFQETFTHPTYSTIYLPR